MEPDMAVGQLALWGPILGNVLQGRPMNRDLKRNLYVKNARVGLPI
jgi:hypothetical protein